MIKITLIILYIYLQIRSSHKAAAAKMAESNKPCKSLGIFDFICLPLTLIVGSSDDVYQTMTAKMVKVCEESAKAAEEIIADVR